MLEKLKRYWPVIVQKLLPFVAREAEKRKRRS